MLTASTVLHRRARPVRVLPKMLHGVSVLGADDTAADFILPPLSPAQVLWSLMSLAATGASAYHGYKRNHSIGWAIAWGLAGGLVPIITVPVALAQGFGRKKG